MEVMMAKLLPLIPEQWVYELECKLDRKGPFYDLTFTHPDYMGEERLRVFPNAVHHYGKNVELTQEGVAKCFPSAVMMHRRNKSMLICGWDGRRTPVADEIWDAAHDRYMRAIKNPKLY